MKVFVVWDVTYEEVVGVFSTKEDAVKYCSIHSEYNLSFECFEVDYLCQM